MKTLYAGTSLAARGLAAAALSFAAALSTTSAHPQAITPAAPAPCSSQVTSDVPQVAITNNLVHALIVLPDPDKGWYRAARFDWSGIVPCLSFDGHTYFSPWRPTHDPMGHDAVAGPVEEFNSLETKAPLGFEDAKTGDLFVKPGVGVLRRSDDAPYKFSTPYPIVDHGKWTYKAKSNEVAITQTITSPVGYAYDYTKTLTLEKGSPVLVIHHHMKNTGTKPIDTDVYDHDFYRLDDITTGPDTSVHFAFTPTLARPFQNGGELVGRDVVYHSELQERQSVQSGITGYSTSPSDYDFIVRNVKTGVGVEQTSDSPIASINFWSVPATIAPEAYIHLHIAPGAMQDWTIRYRFFDK